MINASQDNYRVAVGSESIWSGLGVGWGGRERWRSGENRPDLREGWELARPMGRPQAECAAVGGVGTSLLESMVGITFQLCFW